MELRHTQTSQQPVVIANHQKAQRGERRDGGQQGRTPELEHAEHGRLRNGGTDGKERVEPSDAVVVYIGSRSQRLIHK